MEEVRSDPARDGRPMMPLASPAAAAAAASHSRVTPDGTGAEHAATLVRSIAAQRPGSGRR